MSDKELQQPPIDIHSLDPQVSINAPKKIRRYSPEARARHMLRMRRVWRVSKGEDPNIPELADTPENIARMLEEIRFTILHEAETANLGLESDFLEREKDSDLELWEYARENCLLRRMRKEGFLSRDELRSLYDYFSGTYKGPKIDKLLDKFSLIVTKFN